jgi:hypothetical protein
VPREPKVWWDSAQAVASEPVIRGGFVYATGRDGTLWALHLKGDQRVAWTYRVDGSWGAEPTVLGTTMRSIAAPAKSFGRFAGQAGLITWVVALTPLPRSSKTTMAIPSELEREGKT